MVWGWFPISTRTGFKPLSTPPDQEGNMLELLLDQTDVGGGSSNSTSPQQASRQAGRVECLAWLVVGTGDRGWAKCVETIIL